MTVFLIIILLVITLAMIGLILLQRSEGGGLVSSSDGGMGPMMGRRGTSDILSRTTAILATLFMGMCLLLAILSGHSTKNKSILATIAAEEEVEMATLKEKAEGREANAKAPVEIPADAKKEVTKKTPRT